MRSGFLTRIQIVALICIFCFNAQKAFCEAIDEKTSTAYQAAAGSTLIVSPNSGFGFSSIEQAINAAAPGDTVLVKDGVYSENIVISKSLKLQSEHGHQHTVIAAKNPNLPVVRTLSPAAPALILQGLSLYSPATAQAPCIEMGAATNCQFKDIHLGWYHVEPVAAEITIEPDTVRLGEPVTISWNCSHALYCTIGPDIGPVGISGSMVIFPDRTSSFVITASTPTSAASSDARVDVIVSKTHFRYDAKGQVIEAITEGYFR